MQRTAIASLSQLASVFSAVTFAPLFVTFDSVTFHTPKSDILAGRVLQLHDFETVQVSMRNTRDLICKNWPGIIYIVTRRYLWNLNSRLGPDWKFVTQNLKYSYSLPIGVYNSKAMEIQILTKITATGIFSHLIWIWVFCPFPGK